MRKRRQKLAIIVLTAILCNLQTCSNLWTLAAEKTEFVQQHLISTSSNASKDEKDDNVYVDGQEKETSDSLSTANAREVPTEVNIEYTANGQTIFYLDKGPIRVETNMLDENAPIVRGYNRDGDLITKANEKGYYITVSEKGVDTSKQRIEILDGSDIWLDGINGCDLIYWNYGKSSTLTIVGEVFVGGYLSDFAKIQGADKDAVLHYENGSIQFPYERIVSNLTIYAKSIDAAIENCEVYVDEILTRNFIANNSKIKAKNYINASIGQIKNSELETKEFAIRPGYGGFLKNKDEWWKSLLFTCENSVITCTDCFKLVSMDGKFSDSTINSSHIWLWSDRILVDNNYIERDMNVDFSNSKIFIKNDILDPKEWRKGLQVDGGEYDFSKNDYTFTTKCTLTIKDKSEVLIEGSLLLSDFAIVNIDNSTVSINDSYAAIDGGNGNFEKSTYPQINLSDNVMIADGKYIAWYDNSCPEQPVDWCLRAIIPDKANPVSSLELTIIPIQLSELQKNLENIINSANQQLNTVSVFDGDASQFENGKQFISTNDAETLKNAIKAAETTLSRQESTAADLNNASKTLQQTMEMMKNQIKTGTKSTSSNNNTSDKTTTSGNSSSGSSSRSRSSENISISYPTLNGLNPSIIHGEWQNENGRWRLKKIDGQYAAKQWALLNNHWYLFGTSGYMLTGWALADNQWYYLNPNGTMATGWIQVNGKWYYLNPDGTMAASTITPDGYIVGNDGAWIP